MTLVAFTCFIIFSAQVINGQKRVECCCGTNCNGLQFDCGGERCIIDCRSGAQCRDMEIFNADSIHVGCSSGADCANMKVTTSNLAHFGCDGDCDQIIQVNGCDKYGEIRMKIPADSNSEFCLTVGSLGFNKHSLVWFSSEINLVWRSVSDQGIYCPIFCYNENDQEISMEYDDTDYSLEWDDDYGSGNQIESSERNAKMDTGDGDDFTYNSSDGTICANVDGFNCCLEADDDEDIGYQRDSADTFKAYEAKFECNGDNTNSKPAYFYHS